MTQLSSRGRKTAATRDLFAFLFVGATAALTYVFCSKYVLGLQLPIADWIVGGLLYAAFVPVVYTAHRLISFRSGARHVYALPRYVAVQIGALTVASLMSYLVYHTLDLSHGVGSVLVICASSSFSFVAMRGWAFAEKVMVPA